MKKCPTCGKLLASIGAAVLCCGRMLSGHPEISSEMVEAAARAHELPALTETPVFYAGRSVHAPSAEPHELLPDRSASDVTVTLTGQQARFSAG